MIAFSGLKTLINSAKPLTRKFGDVLTNPEIYRLRKYVGKPDGKKKEITEKLMANLLLFIMSLIFIYFSIYV